MLILFVIECPEDVHHRCLDNSLCFSDDQKCDNIENCRDGSDESAAFCRKLNELIHF